MKKNKVYILGSTITNDNLDKRQEKFNQILSRKSLVEKLRFIDNQNVNLKTLNQIGVHLNEYRTRRLVNNFCYNLIKWWGIICSVGSTIEKSVKTKKENGNLNLKVSIPNTGRPTVFCPETRNNLRANRTTSRNNIYSINSYPQVH